MAFKMKDITDLILPAGVIFLAYTTLNRIFPSKPDAGTCPRGERYTQTIKDWLFGCDTGYKEQINLLNRECVCLTLEEDPLPPPPPPPPPPIDDICSLLDRLNPFNYCFGFTGTKEKVCKLPDTMPSQHVADEYYFTHELITCEDPPTDPPETPCTCEEKANPLSYWNPFSPCFLHDVADTGPCGGGGPPPLPPTPPPVAGACPVGFGTNPVPGCKPAYSCHDGMAGFDYGYDVQFRVYSCLPAPTGVSRQMYDSCVAGGRMPYMDASSRWGCMD